MMAWKYVDQSNSSRVASRKLESAHSHASRADQVPYQQGKVKEHLERTTNAKVFLHEIWHKFRLLNSTYL